MTFVMLMVLWGSRTPTETVKIETDSLARCEEIAQEVKEFRSGLNSKYICIRSK